MPFWRSRYTGLVPRGAVMEHILVFHLKGQRRSVVQLCSRQSCRRLTPLRPHRCTPPKNKLKYLTLNLLAGFLCCQRFQITAINKPRNENTDDVKHHKDLHGPSRRTGQRQRCTEGFRNEEAPRCANGGDKAERRCGISYGLTLCLIVTTATRFHAVDSDLKEYHRNHLERRTTA